MFVEPPPREQNWRLEHLLGFPARIEEIVEELCADARDGFIRTLTECLIRKAGSRPTADRRQMVPRIRRGSDSRLRRS